MRTARKFGSVKKLEDFFEQCQKDGLDMVWRITETLHWYNIQAEEEGLNYGTELAYYQTAKWSEIVDFCSTHCNPGQSSIYGLGGTEELANATMRYIHSIEEKEKENGKIYS